MRLAGTCKKLLSRLLSRPYAAELRHRRPYFPLRAGTDHRGGPRPHHRLRRDRKAGIWRVNVTKGLLNVKWMMKGLTPLTLAGALALSAAPALSWYQGALKYRDYTVDAALVFAYYEKCNAGPIPPELKGRADEKLNMAGPSAARWAKGD